ncbi:MAG: peptide chain release factor 1 [Armatimonadota bacterium]
MDFEKTLANTLAEVAELEQQLSDPDVLSDQNRMRDLSVRHSNLQPLIQTYAEYQSAKADLEEAEAMLKDADDQEMKEFLQVARDEAQEKIARLDKELLKLLLPKDPMDDKNAVIEIRAGTGGDEAALFAGDLMTMYMRLAERRGWETELIDATLGEMGGYKEAVLEVKGRGAYGTLRHESGVHRVQRVPMTESQGRIHTSAATIAVLPEVEEVEMELDPSDLSFENFRAGGPGGQHMQKNETAVRVTHKPTGITVACSDQRSQGANKERAVRLLRSRIYDLHVQEQNAEQAKSRKEQVKSGDRSDKIRTYNFPQDRLTDHRINMTMHNLPVILVGEIDDLLEALAEAERQQKLEEL